MSKKNKTSVENATSTNSKAQLCGKISEYYFHDDKQPKTHKVVLLEKLRRARQSKEIEKRGHILRSSVSKNTTCLVTREGHHSAAVSVKEFSVPVYTPKPYTSLLPTSEDHSGSACATSEGRIVFPKKKQKILFQNLTVNTPQKRPNGIQDLQYGTVLYSTLNQMIIPFVNRNTSAKDLAACLCQQKTNEKGKLPILSQHFGSGKTAFAKQFRNVIAKDEKTMAELRTTYADTFEGLMKAVLVEIDLSKCFRDSDFGKALQKGGVIFNYVISALIEVLEAANNSDLGEMEKSQLEKSIEVAKVIDTASSSHNIPCYDIAEFFQFWAKRKLYPVLLFFDEFSKLNQLMTTFWDSVIHPLEGTSHKNIFSMVAG